MRIKDLTEDFHLVQLSQDIEAIADFLGDPSINEYGCLFVKFSDGDYEAVYGCYDSVPYLHIGLDLLYPKSDHLRPARSGMTDRSQFTQGPWKVSCDPEGRPVYVSRKGGGYIPIATPFREDAFSTDRDLSADYDLKELEANARLITEAPNLLRILEDALFASGYGIDAPIPEADEFSIHTWIYEARAAIARLKGPAKEPREPKAPPPFPAKEP
jgi:hypothetical protein